MAVDNSYWIEELDLPTGSKFIKQKYGLTNGVYSIVSENGGAILKVNNSVCGSWKTAKEISLLQMLSDENFTPQPTVYDAQGGLNNQGYILMTQLPGTCSLAEIEILGSDFYEDCAKHLAKLHNITFTKPGFLHNSETLGENLRWTHLNYSPDFSNDHQYVMSIVMAWCDHLAGKGSRYAPLMAEMIDRMNALEVCFKDETYCLIHDDFSLKNILSEEGSFTGIVDFEFARSGDPSFDLHHFCMKGLEKGIETTQAKHFLSAYDNVRDLPDSFWEKGEFVHYYWCFQKIITLKPTLDKQTPEEQEKTKSNLYDWIEEAINKQGNYWEV